MTCRETWSDAAKGSEAWSTVSKGAEAWTDQAADSEPYFNFFLTTEDCAVLTTEAGAMLYLEAE